MFYFLLFITSLFSVDLSTHEKSLYSAHGEDGLIARIFELLEPQSRYCVEIGAGDGITKSNTYLLRLQDWHCSLFDRTNELTEFKLYKEFINANNINEIFQKYLIPQQIDLLCIDNFNEFYIWHALDPKYQPRVVIIKYNASLLLEDKVAKYCPFYCGDGTNYFGASIKALYHLGRKKGYSLIYAESIGMNLFFIRDDVLKEKNLQFKNANDVEKLFRYPAYANGPHGGYKQDPKNREYFPSWQFLASQPD